MNEDHAHTNMTLLAKIDEQIRFPGRYSSLTYRQYRYIRHKITVSLRDFVFRILEYVHTYGTQ